MESLRFVLPQSEIPTHWYNVVADLDKSAWPRPKLFQWLQAEGNVAEDEMHRVFNCGIGMVIVVPADKAAAAQAALATAGEAVWQIGTIRARNGDEHQTQVR
mgnify:CR=1 FL=1